MGILSLLAFLSLALSTADLYKPADYVGKLRVPPGCQLEKLSCPNCWKAGITDGASIALPLIDADFVECHEGLTKCGYVPIDPVNGEVLGQSGVTIGGGVDLGSKDRKFFDRIGVAKAVSDKLEPYLGLKKGAAAAKIIANPLSLTVEQARDLTTKVKNSIVSSVEARYKNDRKTGSLAFRSLPRAMRTAIADVWFQFGPPDAYPKFWGFVTKNDWKGAIKELENFYGNPSIQQPGDRKRRQNEADIIRAVLEKLP